MHESARITEWKFFLRSRDAWDAMLADCERARVSIDLEQYIFEHDEIGSRFIHLLERKAAEGIRVRLLCDMAGSYDLYNSAHHHHLSDSGVEVEFFNIIRPWRINNYSSWLFRDHRKVLVIDSHVGYVGGVGIHQRMHDWRDTHVRIAGPVVHELQYVFDQMWNRTKEGVFFRFSKPEAPADPARRRSFFSNALRNGSFAFTRRYKKNMLDGIAKHFYFLTNSPRFHQRFIYHSLIDAIRGARRSIFLTTPYFIPDLRLLRVLRLAAHRGIDVRLIVPDASDHPIVDIASQSYFGILLKAGVKIFAYQDHVLHAKTIVIDDDWASVGSANLDNLSLLFNYEANLASTNRAFVRELREQFLSDLSRCRQIDRDEWKRRDIVRKALEVLSWPIHKFL